MTKSLNKQGFGKNKQSEYIEPRGDLLFPKLSNRTHKFYQTKNNIRIISNTEISQLQKTDYISP